MQVSRFLGPKRGQSTAIVYGIHGNEPAGVEAVARVTSLLKKKGIEQGVVSFIPGNLEAMKKNQRQIDMNLNRCFLSKFLHEPVRVGRHMPYEQRRAKVIAPELALYDVMLDLHSTDEPGDPFFITEPSGLHITRFMPSSIKSVLLGLDEFHPGSTDWFMHSLGKVGICLECGQHSDERAATVGEQGILSFLHLMNHIPQMTDIVYEDTRTYCTAQYIYTTKTNDFILTRSFPEFTALKRGEHIATDGGVKVFAPRDYDSLIVFSNPCDKVGEEAFVLTQKI